MENHSKRAKTIPVVDLVKGHVKSQSKLVRTRGDRHRTPAKEKDVETWRDIAVAEEWFKLKEGRTFKNTGNRAKDFVTEGLASLAQSRTIQDWWDNRTFPRETSERWLDEEKKQRDEEKRGRKGEEDMNEETKRRKTEETSNRRSSRAEVYGSRCKIG